MYTARRITLIARDPEAPSRAWDTSSGAPSRMIFVGGFALLRHALDHASQDVERLLIDETATPAEFLELLSTLPQTFVGDVLLMRGDTSYLSSAGRADGRLLYALTAEDLQFYLETNGLVVTVQRAA